MVDVVQLVRASDCGSECRGFEPHPPPKTKSIVPNNKRRKVVCCLALLFLSPNLYPITKKIILYRLSIDKKCSFNLNLKQILIAQKTFRLLFPQR